MTRRAYLGKEAVVYCENSEGHVFLTSFESPIPEGFVRKVADTVTDVEKIWKRLDQQEKDNAAKMSYQIFEKRQRGVKHLRDFADQRMKAADCSNAEKDFLREWITILNRKQKVMDEFSVYGVAHMQEVEAPLPASVNKVTDA